MDQMRGLEGGNGTPSLSCGVGVSSPGPTTQLALWSSCSANKNSIMDDCFRKKNIMKYGSHHTALGNLAREKFALGAIAPENLH
jgi:hypothetical protein